MAKLSEKLNIWLKKAAIDLLIAILIANFGLTNIIHAQNEIGLLNDILGLSNGIPLKEELGTLKYPIQITSDASIIGSNMTGSTKRMKVKITAYSSTPEQTDEDPFVMASGKHVYDGAAASNFLKFGTKIKIPKLFGDKIFTIEDRMHKRFSNRIDIWFPDSKSLKEFGVQETEVIIL